MVLTVFATSGVHPAFNKLILAPVLYPSLNPLRLPPQHADHCKALVATYLTQGVA